ncbi:glycosyltransferase family 2 protein [Mesobacillus harenae]|uniref:glycosyltransferase family 2 protein n=1 Tax=Mesobacillus harenae TaxID=2213203 RepID=UPI0015800007|nr:glycosyltransferase family 2 protein [Mesobacillus harenae]
MKVTVVIPTYNVENYIVQCLKSVLNQSLTDFEIIVIDDVSSDRTVELIKTLAEKDPRIKLLINKKNSGPAHSRNRGIKEAAGDYVAFLDSDDWWDHDRLNEMVGIAEKFDAEMVCDDQMLIDDNKTVPWGTVFTNGGLIIAEPTKFSAADFINNNMGLKPLLKTNFLHRNNILFNEDLRYGEDYLLFLDCLLHRADAYLLPVAYYYYRAREGSLVTNNMKLLEQTLQTTEKLLRDPFYVNDTSVKEALKKRKKDIKEAIKYYKFMQPIKDGKTTEGIGQLIKSPATLLIFARRLPKIFKNRVYRKMKNR